MAKVIIFGVRDFASVAHFYLKHDSPHEVVGFSVSRSYMLDPPVFEGLPVVPFEEVEQHYGPAEYAFFAPMSCRDMNRLREAIYLQIKAKGYPLISYISSRATVFPGTPIGENCFILENNTIQLYATIGNNVMMWAGNLIGHHSQVKDHVFFSSHVVVAGHSVIEPYCFFGINSTVNGGVRVAEGTYVAMSAAIAKDTEPWCTYLGIYSRKGLESSEVSVSRDICRE